MCVRFDYSTTRNSSSEFSNFYSLYPLDDPLLDFRLRSDSDLVGRLQFLFLFLFLLLLLLLPPIHSFLAIICHCCFFLSFLQATLLGLERIGGIRHPSAFNHFSLSLPPSHSTATSFSDVHRSLVVISSENEGERKSATEQRGEMVGKGTVKLKGG